jgi:hypothetical protein
LPEESLESCKKTLAWISSDHGVLDTASVFAMTLHFINSQSEFASAVEKNPEKYGYSFPDEQDQVSGSFLSAMARNWRNDYMDFETASRLESEFLKKRVSPESRFKMPGVGAFGMAGLGIDLDLFFTTPLSKLPWHKISLAKDQRVQEYKNKFYKVLNIKKLEEALIL